MGINPYAPPADDHREPTPQLAPEHGPPQGWEVGEVLGFAFAAVRANWAVVVPAFFIYMALEVGPGALLRTMAAQFGHGRGVAELAVVARHAVVVLSTGLILPGFVRILLAAARREETHLVTLFGGADRFVPMAALAFCEIAPGLLMELAHNQRVSLVVVAIVSAILYSGLNFAKYYVVDQNFGALDAFRAAWALTRGQHLKVLGFAFVASFVCVIGIVACGVGVLVTASTAMMGFAVIYLRLSGRGGAAMGRPIG
jgi:hypothetical protein